jgi:hypothetical protein
MILQWVAGTEETAQVYMTCGKVKFLVFTMLKRGIGQIVKKSAEEGGLNRLVR